MNRKLFTCLSIWISVCSIAAYSIKKKSEDDVKPPPLTNHSTISANHIINKSLEAMHHIKGYQWYIEGILSTATHSQKKTRQMNWQVEYLNEHTYHIQKEVSPVVETKTHWIKNNLIKKVAPIEIYVKNHTVYTKTKKHGPWFKRKIMPMEGTHRASLIPQNVLYDAIQLLNLVKIEASKVKVTEHTSEYQLHLQLTEHKHGRIMSQPLSEHIKIMAGTGYSSNQTYNPVHLTLSIDKKSFRLTKVTEHTQIITSPTPNSKSATLNQTFTLFLKKEVNKIQLPFEAQKPKQNDRQKNFHPQKTI